MFYLEHVDFDLDDVLANVAAVTGGRAQDKGLEYLFDVPPDVPRRLRGDPLRLGQVLINLANNAVKFTEHGEVRLSAAVAALDERSVTFDFEVRDTGIGMSEDQATRLFQAFTQADGSTTRKFGGTGLGLSISRRLVEMMGGQISVESREGEGSTFRFSARLELSSSEAEVCRVLPSAFNGLRVLVVDDNPVARDVMVGALDDLPFRVDAVDSGAAALAAIRGADQDDPFGVVLTDWQMKGLDGIELTRQVKNDPLLAEPPVMVLVTAFGREEIRNRAEQAAVDGFLLKPVNRSTLIDTLVTLVGARDDDCPDPAVLPREAGLDGARALLVEDNEVNQQIARELLEGMGLAVDVVGNGRDAVERLDGLPPDHYALVFMDLQMPVMDGHEATLAIRADARFDALPIVAMTAHAMVEERERCLREGMQDHISKPIEPTTLQACVRRWIIGAAAAAVAEPAVAFDDDGLPRLPGLDAREGLRRVAGNRTLYRKLLGQFHDRFGDSAQRIAQWLPQDRQAAEREAHSLKGVAANLGATEVQLLAEQVETGLREGEPDAALRPRLTRLGQSLAGLCALLGRALAETAPGAAAQSPAAAPTPAPAGQLLELAAGLSRLLADNDGDAIDLIERHGPILRQGLGDSFAAVEQAASQYDYDAAHALLGALAVRAGLDLGRAAAAWQTMPYEPTP
ncbi:response regulator [Chitinimonas koreensis]|uniref:response regulator n=1 Tax=Chitinimonas koreensis TaxID=356302 RepID=UPI0006864E7A|nr:response regulator [Chitinimonas koreensis]